MTDAPLLALVRGDAETLVAETEPSDAEIVAAGLDPESVRANPFSEATGPRRLAEDRLKEEGQFWDDAHDAGIVVANRQDHIAVYLNPYNVVCIRRGARDDEPEDPFTLVTFECLQPLIDRLTELRNELVRLSRAKAGRR